MVIKLLALDKWARLVKIIIYNGGPFKAFFKLWRTDTLKVGQFMGSDSFGNNYYQSDYYMLGRSRWVEYAPTVKWQYDASQITPEWYGWLHYKTDRTPCEDCAKYCLMSSCYASKWLLPHVENVSGTDQAFYPYSTTRARIEPWDELTNYAKLGRALIGEECPLSEQDACSPPALSEDQQVTPNRKTTGTSTKCKLENRQDWQHFKKSFH